MKPVEIVELSGGEGAQDWSAYVDARTGASLYHRLEWRDILERSFGHRSCYLMARHDDAIRGVLPLFEVQSVLFGHFLVSIPFLNYGGILSDGPEYEIALAAAAMRLAANRKAHHIELRQSAAHSALAAPHWHLTQHKAALVVRLKSNPDVLWTRLTSRLRGKVRKAEKSGAHFSITGSEGLSDFYRVFALNMRDLGTPVHSPAFFRNILRLADNTAVLLVHRQGQPVASAIALRRGTRVELPWMCSDYGHASAHVNEYLYWNAIAWAARSGAEDLDLGRSTIRAGTYRFKTQWNPTAQPLYWYYWLAPGANLPNLSPDNSKYALAIRCWKKLPVPLANLVGPSIIRNIP